MCLWWVAQVVYVWMFLLLLVSPLERRAVDLLVQGVYARKMVAQPETGADLVSAVWGFIMLGNLAASAFVGFFANSHPPIFFWATLPFAVQVLVPVAIGWLSEDPAPRGFQRAKVHANRRFFMLGGLMTAGALGMVPASLYGSPIVQAAYSIAVSAVLCGSCLALLPKQIGTTGGRGGRWSGLCKRGQAAVRADACGTVEVCEHHPQRFWRKEGGSYASTGLCRGDSETYCSVLLWDCPVSLVRIYSCLSSVFTFSGRAQVYMYVAVSSKEAVQVKERV